MKKLDELGDRMKSYERVETSDKFDSTLPVYARIDGRAFSKFTKNMKRPFDPDMCAIMQMVTIYLVKETGAKVGYTQSDEISLVWYNDNPNASMMFDGKKQKLTSTLAALATAKFVQEALVLFPDECGRRLPTFDCRVFQLPNTVEAANAVLWRFQDCVKNSVSMNARAHFSHKECLNKNTNQLRDMLMLGKGINHDLMPASFKYGTFVKRDKYIINEGEECEAVRSYYGLHCFDFGKLSTEDKVDFIFQ